MITKKKIIIPIFEYHLSIYIYDNADELKGIIPDECFNNYFRGITISGPFYSTVAIDTKHGSTIAHESLHIVNNLWKSIGYTPQRDNDEVSAYLLTYIYSKITDVFYKHNGEKH